MEKEKEKASKKYAALVGERKTTVMRQIAKGYSDLQTEQIAIYFSQQKP